MKTGELIRKYRCAQQLTTKQVGDYMGLSGGAISQYERGVRTIKKEVFEKIAKYLDISEEDLLALDDYECESQVQSDMDNTSSTDTMNVCNPDIDSDIIFLSDTDEYNLVSNLSSLFNKLDYNLTLAYKPASNKFAVSLEDTAMDTSTVLEVHELINIKEQLKKYLGFIMFNLNKQSEDKGW
ncbi:Helix-turn-helix [uncultured Clostridium sp.]|nr:Helix-turn-helix [uncultured Clostridium sp.]